MRKGPSLIGVILTLAWYVIIAYSVYTLAGDIRRTEDMVTRLTQRKPTVLHHTVVDSEAPAAIGGCPTEDSCAIDYRDGTWYVTPQVP